MVKSIRRIFACGLKENAGVDAPQGKGWLVAGGRTQQRRGAAAEAKCLPSRHLDFWLAGARLFTHIFALLVLNEDTVPTN